MKYGYLIFLKNYLKIFIQKNINNKLTYSTKEYNREVYTGEPINKILHIYKKLNKQVIIYTEKNTKST